MNYSVSVMTRFLSLLFIVLLTSPVFSQNYLRVNGQKIVDGSGNEILLKGIGLGGWLVQEGYMFGTSSFANAQWEIKKKIETLIGATNTDLYYKKFRTNFIKREDIQQIKTWGFNSIRLPMHYNLMTPLGQPGVWIEEGFTIIDSLLSWCEESQIYLILDLHAAPGGQNSSNISDYNPAAPSLWQSDVNKQSTVLLWKKIAERYSTKRWIGGYDLLNETVWNFGGNNQPLRDLYIQITQAIRQVDTNHIIYIEGNQWANDFTTLTPPWDANMVYSFHKYWNENSVSAIQSYLNLRTQTNRPLWCGESGENSNQWFADAIALLQANNIGWAWWSHKKLESISGLTSIVKPAEYDVLLRYWSGQAPQPTVAYAVDALDKFAQKTLLSQCVKNTNVIDAMFRMPGNTSTLPYYQVSLPGIIYAPLYDLGQNNYAYKDNDFQNLGSGFYNSGWTFRNDGVDIERCSDSFSNGYDIGWIETGEWLNYTVNIAQAGVYKADFRVASPNSSGMMIIRCDNNVAGKMATVSNTGGWSSWGNAVSDSVLLPAGKHTIMIQVLNGGFNLNYIEFTFLRPTAVEQEVNGLNLKLTEAHPNPFTDHTSINYEIAESAKVNIIVYDLLGSKVAELVNAEKDPGSYSVDFNGESLPSGTYLIHFSAGKFRETKKIVLLN